MVKTLSYFSIIKLCQAVLYTVTVKCRTAIKTLFLYFNLYLSVMLDRLSCTFTSISFLYAVLGTCDITLSYPGIFMQSLKKALIFLMFLFLSNVLGTCSIILSYPGNFM